MKGRWEQTWKEKLEERWRNFHPRHRLNIFVVNSLVGFPIGRGILKWMFQHGWAYRHRYRKWTIEHSQDLKVYHSIDVEEELTKIFIEEMNREIKLNPIEYDPADLDQIVAELFEVEGSYSRTNPKLPARPAPPPLRMIKEGSISSIPEIEIHMTSQLIVPVTRTFPRKNPRYK